MTFGRVPTLTMAAGGLAAFLMPAGAAEIGALDLYDLPDADVVILGEVHDNPVHHAHQAIVVAALDPRAIVFEMLTEAQADRIRPEHFDSESMLSEVLGWEASGWPDFAMYYPVFVAGRQAVMIGGAIPRADARRAMQEGAAAVFGDDAPLFGLDLPLPGPEQAAREADQAEAHCDALPPAMLPGMVEAQRLRDAALARAVRTALAAVGAPVAVITGNGHARRDRGLPVALQRALPEVTVLSVGQFEAPPRDGAPFDLWLVTEPVARDDPCDVFR